MALEVSLSEVELWEQVLMTIGYWGQTSSFVSCLETKCEAPDRNECVMPLRSLQFQSQLHPFYSCLLSEFRKSTLTWDDVVPSLASEQATNPLTLDIYVWPMRVLKQQPGGRLLVRSSF